MRTTLKPKSVPQPGKKKKCQSKKKKPKKTESIMHIKDGTCYLCMLLHGNRYVYGYTEEHHIFYGIANRKLSEQCGLKVYLCMGHHRGDINGKAEAVHGNKEINTMLRVAAQTAFEETNTRQEFIKLFEQNYLD